MVLHVVQIVVFLFFLLLYDLLIVLSDHEVVLLFKQESQLLRQEGFCGLKGKRALLEGSLAGLGKVALDEDLFTLGMLTVRVQMISELIFVESPLPVLAPEVASV